jgi:hypothetical protein
MVYNNHMMNKQPYILIKPSGAIMVFTVLACAELYQKINGGTLVLPCCVKTTGGLTIAAEPV